MEDVGGDRFSAETWKLRKAKDGQWVLVLFALKGCLGVFSISMLCEFQYLMLKLVLERLSYIYKKVVSYMVYHSRVLSVCHFIPGLYGNCAGNFICMTDG